MSGASIAGSAKWLKDDHLQKLLGVLSADGEEALVVGGAVRNTLLGDEVGDIDIATTIVPDETMRRARAAGFKAVPTGYEHGTVTVVAGHRAYEVTTLRADVETHGRHATVRFGRDWKADAERRDFTINALYADASGRIHDFVGGLADIESRTLRFIGDAETRIREDYLRILRFFRFYAFYGHGRPDADGLKACARMKDGIDGLSAERVWSEFKKLLSAGDCSRAILWMRQTGVLTRIVPESEKWGVDAMSGLIAAERRSGWPPDPLLRLMAIIPPRRETVERLAERLRLSRKERGRLEAWADAQTQEVAGDDAGAALYRDGAQGHTDRLRLALASALASGRGEEGAIAERLAFVEGWKKPVFPIRGRDVTELGVASGPAVGELLAGLEAEWIASGFTLSRAQLMQRAAELAGGGS